VSKSEGPRQAYGNVTNLKFALDHPWWQTGEPLKQISDLLAVLRNIRRLRPNKGLVGGFRRSKLRGQSTFPQVNQPHECSPITANAFAILKESHVVGLL
jgi:hypothetical protein